MPLNTFTDSVRISPQGALTLPKDVRDALGVGAGGRVSFVVQGSSVQLVNTAVYAMNVIQDEMEGEAERLGFSSEKDAMAFIDDLRKAEE